MQTFLEKWATWKQADKSLKLEGSQSKTEKETLNPLQITEATKGKPPSEVAVKSVDTSPNIQPRVQSQPIVTTQSNNPQPVIQPPSPVQQINRGDVSTINSQTNYAKMAEIRNLQNFLNFIKSGVAARSLLNVNITDYDS